MKISVVIPAYNSEKTISLCIKSLQAQLHLPDEIIVVDNNSTDNTVKIVSDLAKKTKLPHLICVIEDKRGAAAARNKGIKCAIGDIIAFTDSDCIPRTDWIKNIHSNFIEDKELDVLGGVTFGYSPKSIVQKVCAIRWSRVYKNKNIEFLSDIKTIPVGNCVATHNVVYKRDLIEKIGLFDESFPAAEDIDYCYRAIEAKAKIKNYVSEIVVLHIDRNSVIKMIQQQFTYGVYQVKLAKKHFSNNLIIELPFSIRKVRQNMPKLLWIKITNFHIFVLCLFLILIDKVFLILLFLFLLLLGNRINKSLENVGVKNSLMEQIGILVLFILAKTILVFGRLYGSVKYGVICI